MKKKFLLTSILSIIMCLSLTVGGTFALFTSKSETNVAVTSGTVNVTAEVNTLKYKTLTKDWTDFADGETSTNFDNLGGSATVNGGEVVLDKIVPGDGLSFNVDVTNNSDVKVKYRTVVKNAEDSNADLFNALDVTINGAKYSGLALTTWEELEASTNGQVVETISVKVELPKDASGENLMGKTCKFVVTVEAVQGNAPVANVTDGETTTETVLEDANGNGAVAPAGVKMKDGETTLSLKIEEDAVETGNFVLGEGQEAVGYEISIPEVSEDNEEEILVTFNTKKTNLTNVLMFHKGEKMNRVANASDLSAHNEFYYDADSGKITISTKSFSNFTVVDAGKLQGTLVYTADELVAALENNQDVVFARDIKIDPANMSNAYGTTGINVKNGQTIDGSGHILNIKGAGGTWDSGINTTGGIIKNITVTGSFRGIFINHNSTYSETVVLENVITDGTVYTISCDQGENAGLVATNCTFNGWTSYAATLGNAKFVNCTFSEGSGYAFCRPYAATEFVGCEFEAGFEMDPRATVTFEGCTLDGDKITAENLSTLVTSNIANATVKE